MADDVVFNKAAIIRMVGFRNVAIHDYRRLDLEIVQAIVTAHLDDFLAFTTALLQQRE